MPRAPILSRELLYTTNPDGSFRLLDWCLVNTSIGAMIEPRNLQTFNGGNVRGLNVYEAGITAIKPFNEDEFYAKTRFSGRQVPLRFDR